VIKLDSAWQAALAAEHQAAFGYSLLGPQLSGADQQRAINCSNAHESLRNGTSLAIAAAGLTPVPPQADYPALYPVANAAAAAELAVRLEDDCAVAWRFLYLQAASTTGTRATALRSSAQQALIASAVRGAQWRVTATPAHPTMAFPGT
jgi:Domain of unknown function (DUF4439)